MVNQYKAGELSDVGYELRYRECVLQNVSREFILDHYDNCVLCCWEAPDKWCHRRIVRKWIAEKTGVIVSELDADRNYVAEAMQIITSGEKIVEPMQMSLF